MKTYFKIPCPGCREVLPIRAEFFGKRVACKRCKHVFIAEAKNVMVETAAAPPAAVQPDPEVQQLRDRVAQLEKELHQARDEAADRTADRDAVLKQGALLEEQLQTLRLEIAETPVQQSEPSEAARQELAEARAEAEWLRSLVADLQDGEARAAEKEAHLTEALTAAEARAQEFEVVCAERDRLREEIEQARAAHQESHSGWEKKLELHGQTAEEQLRQERDKAQQLHADHAGALQDAERVRSQVAELQAQVTRAADAEARLRSELAAAIAKAKETDNLRAERDRLETLLKQPAAERAQHTDWDGSVLQKALEGVTPNSGWPYFDPARPEAPPRPAAVAAAAGSVPANDELIEAAKKEFAREKTHLQSEVQRLRKENGVLRDYLQNFGVQMIEM